MPHLSLPVAMLIGSGVAGGSALASAKMGSNAAKKATATQQQLANEAAARSKPAYDAAYNYYNSLLSGDPSKVMQAVGPDVNAASLQFDQARKNLLNTAQARGGSLTTGLANIEAGRAVTLSNIMNSTRPGAASALAALAGADTSAAAQLLGGANQASAYSGLLRGQALESLGGILTRLLSTPGLFTRGAPSQFPMTPGLPPAIASINNPRQVAPEYRGDDLQGWGSMI